MKFCSSALIIATLSMLSWMSQAQEPIASPLIKTDNTPTKTSDFQKTCVDTWVKKEPNNAEFKQFGVAYCLCAEGQQPLDSDAAINKAIQVCMSRTLLQQAITTVTSSTPLAEIPLPKMKEACMHQWDLVYPHLNAKDKQIAESYCDCAAPKLIEIGSAATQEQDVSNAINGIAAQCSGHEGK